MVKDPISTSQDSFLDKFNWQLIEKKAKIERDIAFLHKREEELQIPVVGLSGKGDRIRREKKARIRAFIQAKLSYLEIIKQKLKNR